VYPKVSVVGHNEITTATTITLIKKQQKRLWRQNSLD